MDGHEQAFTLRLLGGADLSGPNGRPVRSVLAQPRRFALLAVLALAEPGTTVRRDTLLAVFWPDSDASHARGALRNALHFLRQSLGDRTIRNHGTEALLVDPDRLVCDARVVRERLAAGDPGMAVDRYTGALLAGFHLDDAPEFEHWLESERDRLRSEVAAAAWRAADTAEADGRIERAQGFARRAVELSGGAERDFRRAMELFERTGDRAAALALFDALESRLREEFGCAPSPETLHLAASIRESPPVGPPPPRREPEYPLPPPTFPTPALPASARRRSDDTAPRPDAAARHPDPAVASDHPGAGACTRRRWRVRALVLASLAALLVAVSLVAVHRPPGAGTADSFEVVAVLPFRYHGGGEHAFLGEGIVRLLSTNLDGAGRIRTVDPRVLLGTIARDQPDLARPATALALVSRFGAGVYVAGDIVEVGDRLRITAGTYAGSGRRAHDEVTVEGGTDEVLVLVDRLAAELLARWNVGPAARLTRLAAVTTPSIPALKAFLEGEHFYRTGRYNTAMEAFLRAIETDSAFALAHYRLSTSAVWAGVPELENAGRASAMRFRERLTPRDRWLVQAWIARPDSAEGLYEAVLSRYPDEVEAWLQLAEIRFHWRPVHGVPARHAASAFERALRLEPDNVQAMIHLARLAAMDRDRDRFELLAGRLRRAGPGADLELELDALGAVPNGDPAARDALLDRAQRLDPDARLRLVNATVLYGGDLELAILLLRPDIRAADRARRATALELTAHLEFARGRADAGAEALARVLELDPPRAVRPLAALFGAALANGVGPDILPLDRVRRVLDRLDSGAGVTYATALSALLQGDLSHARALAATLEARPDEPAARAMAAIVRAELDHRAGRPDLALERLEALRPRAEPADPLVSDLEWAHARWLRAVLLERTGRTEEAREVLGSFPDPAAYFYDVAYHSAALRQRAAIARRDADPSIARSLEARAEAMMAGADPVWLRDAAPRSRAVPAAP
jgi:DNA-binding SARP family transcriptional activator/tetratricopeptide (TPR) repeat protein